MVFGSLSEREVALRSHVDGDVTTVVTRKRLKTQGVKKKPVGQVPSKRC